jgi:hypothetical protein
MEHRTGRESADGVGGPAVGVPLVQGREEILDLLLGRLYARLLRRPEQFLKFNFDALMRGDAKTRWAAYESGLRWGVYSLNEVRALEDRNPLEQNGDVRPFPLTYAPLDRVVEMPLPTDPPGPRPGPSGDSNA